MTKYSRAVGIGMFAVMAVTLGACSSKSASTATTAAAAPTTAPTATTSAPPKTSAPPTTSAPTTTAAPAGPSLTQQQQSAVKEAKQYLDTQAFSQQGLIDQLDSAAGSGYSVADATAAVNSLTVDWNAQAVKSAKEYLSTQPFSCSALIDQLDSSAGGQFTVAQATYGAQQAQSC